MAALVVAFLPSAGIMPAMRRLGHAFLCLILFAAAMEGLLFLSGDGISREFSVGFCFGAMAGFAVVFTLTDHDYSGAWPTFTFAAFAAAACGFWGYHLGRLGPGADLLIGPLVGFGVVFPLVYWTTGRDRRQNGFPRPPLSWPWSRRNRASQPY